MNIYGIDIETYSTIDLTKTNVYKYTDPADSGFEVLLLTYQASTWAPETSTLTSIGEPQTLDLYTAGVSTAPQSIDSLVAAFPEHEGFLRSIGDGETVLTAFNAAFERVCLSRLLGLPVDRFLPPEQWRDTMVAGLELGLPRSLAAQAEALGLPADKQKDKRGKDLIKLFSCPQRDGSRVLPEALPEAWEEYKAYNAQDVVAEQTLFATYFPRHWPSQQEWPHWHLSEHINDRGVAVDLPMVRSIVDFAGEHQAKMLQQLKELTGLDNPASDKQFIDWLTKHKVKVPMKKNNKGEKIPTIDATHWPTVVEASKKVPADIQKAVELRPQVKKTSLKKYDGLLAATCSDGRLRGSFMFYGAHTGRFVSSGGVQLQNLPKNHMGQQEIDDARQLVIEQGPKALPEDDVVDILSQLIRTAFIPAPGHTFVVTDFSAIEARVIAWLAGEDWQTEVFRNSGDIYCATASKMFDVPVVKGGENGELRAQGKVASLACGFGGGVNSMAAMDVNHAIDPERYPTLVDDWRRANPRIKQMWYALERAAKRATGNNETVPTNYWGLSYEVAEIDTNHKALQARLPNGRCISYYQPAIELDKKGRSKLTYLDGRLLRTETYYGPLAENVVQGIARDILLDKMKRLSDLGYKSVMHVHDEIIFEVPVEDLAEACTDIDRVMAEPIDDWAYGLPLQGSTYITNYYRKD